MIMWNRGVYYNMKIKEGFVLRRVLDEAVVIASGEASKSFHGMVKLNDTAADIWGYIADGLSEGEIAKKLAEEYDVSIEKAAEDTKTMLAQMAEAGLLEE